MTLSWEPMDLAHHIERRATAKMITYKTLYAAIKRKNLSAIRVAGLIRLDPRHAAERLRARATSTMPAMRRAA